MKENKLTIRIHRPIDEVFEFTTNPNNTHLWIPSIHEEVAEEYPPKVNTKYKNRGTDSGWDFYKVVTFEKNKAFVLSDLDENYFVRYTYRGLGANETKMEYFEWVTAGELKNPFTEDILQNLKSVLEQSNLIRQIAEIVEDACKKETNYFGYGIWKYHIVNVVKYAKMMAKKLGADEEIVEIASLLHDYASVIDHDLYEDHHIHGAVEAEKLLKQFNYPQDKIEKVKECIISHRGSKVIAKESKEALCVADADAMSHFDSIGSLFYLAFFSHKMDIDAANEWLMQKLERSWSKLSPEAKEIIGDKYQACKLILKRQD
ncbi:MAG: HD domain-containing protein [Candidatus Woesearchaeota archaeon]